MVIGKPAEQRPEEKSEKTIYKLNSQQTNVSDLRWRNIWRGCLTQYGRLKQQKLHIDIFVDFY